MKTEAKVNSALVSLEEETKFICELRGRYREHRGDVAALKRNAGNVLQEARGVAWFYGILPPYLAWAREDGGEDNPREQNVWFLVATLVASDRAFLEAKTEAPTNASLPADLGESMERIWQKVKPQRPMKPEEESWEKARSAVGRRMAMVLNASFDPSGGGEMQFRMRQTARYILAHEAPIHWAQLLYDLRYWNAPSKRVQKRWAQRFYAPMSTEDDRPDAEPDTSES